MRKVRTRFAPSPTGQLHVGSLRTALYAYALAKHNGGDFILRIEDTDQKRQVEGASDSVKSVLEKFGLLWDEFYVQSERKEQGFYVEAARRLVLEGHAFYCQCGPRENLGEGYSVELRDPCRDKSFTSGAIKLRVPEGRTIKYRDFVHGKEISWNTSTVYDATLLKSDGYPTYHLAAMADDLDEKISHVLRGHDWLPSTPITLLVFEYLGGDMPEIGHLTDILSAETGKKLSKRRDSVFVEQYLEDGYLADALLNFIMLLGWAPKDNREIFSLGEFVESFSVDGFQVANPKFLVGKLDWMNGEYIRRMEDVECARRIFEFFGEKYSEDMIQKTIPLVKTRINKWTEYESLAGFIFVEPDVDKSLFGDNYNSHLGAALSVIEELGEWKIETLNDSLMNLVNESEFKTGKFFMDLRVAIAGKKVTPPLNESMIILGKQKVIERLQKVVNK